MTERLKELAEEVVRLTRLVETLGLQNSFGRTLAQTITADATYMLVRDALSRAQREYDSELRYTSDDKLRALIAASALRQREREVAEWCAQIHERNLFERRPIDTAPEIRAEFGLTEKP